MKWSSMEDHLVIMNGEIVQGHAAPGQFNDLRFESALGTKVWMSFVCAQFSRSSHSAQV